MEGTDVARESLSFLLVDFKLFDCKESAKDNFLFGVELLAPLDNEGSGGGGGGGKKPELAGRGGGGGGKKPEEAGGGGGGGGGGPPNDDVGSGGMGVAGMLP